MSQITQLLTALEAGESHAADCLLPMVYEELRRLAASKLEQEKPGHTLDATALVHEAYLRLVQPEPNRQFTSRLRSPDQWEGHEPV